MCSEKVLTHFGLKDAYKLKVKKQKIIFHVNGIIIEIVSEFINLARKKEVGKM